MTVALTDVLNEAKALSQTDSYNQFGTTDAIRTERVADLVTRAVEEFMEKNPVIGLTSTTQAITSAAQSYAIPADLRGLDILKITYNDSGSDSYWDLRELEYMDRDAVRTLPVEWRNGEVTTENPTLWSFDEDASHIWLYPAPSASKTLVIHYRQEPTEITAGNVTSPDAVNIAQIPKRWQRVVALKVAVGMAEIKNPEKAARLAELYGIELYECQRYLARVLAAGQPGQAAGDHPHGLLNKRGLLQGFNTTSMRRR